jgi:hypothetical protein
MAATVTSIPAAKSQNPSQPWSLRAANMWLRLVSSPVEATSNTCTMMNATK